MKQKLNYFEERHISQNAFIPKVNDETAVETVHDFKYVLSKLAKKKYVTFQDLLKFSKVLLIYKDIGYVSEHITIPEGIIESKYFKKILTKSLKDERSILKFLRSGIIVIDVNNFKVEYISGYNPDQNFFIFTDYTSHFPPVKEIIFLNELCQISDELYIELFGKDAYQKREDEKNTALLDESDEEYIALLEEYEDLYD